MNAVGEWVGREPAGLSLPRGESATPYTVACGRAALSASYVVARSCSNAGAAASEPSGANCGSQKRLRFGSLPTMKSCTYGYCFATETAKAAKSERAVSVSGVTLEPYG